MQCAAIAIADRRPWTSRARRRGAAAPRLPLLARSLTNPPQGVAGRRIHSAKRPPRPHSSQPRDTAAHLRPRRCLIRCLELRAQALNLSRPDLAADHETRRGRPWPRRKRRRWQR